MAALSSDIFDFSMQNGTLLEFFNKANSFTDVGYGGILGILILLVVGVVLFLMMKSYGLERAFGVTGISIFIIGLFMRIFGLVNDYVLYICIVLLVVGFILLLKDSAQYET